ncbi:NAD-dependent succinate-semialdehyde dehydrogenase [Larkinella sp.]|uniref:NAD-dependent succinate-semialdehyde dehydrogenase n=1 Tax=Larkinella sp. TaxID=2034517 RepID=UPI003BA9ED08
MNFTSVNPYTQKKIKSYPALRAESLDQKIKKADRAFTGWSALSLEERLAYFRNVAVHLRQEKQRYGALMTAEMGKTLKEAVAEVEKCAVGCDYYVENAPRFLADLTIKTEAKKSFVAYEPLGVVLAVMPWNFPFWQVFRFAIPSLLAGNVGLLKHAANVSGCSLAIEEIFRACDFPTGTFQSLLIESKTVETVLKDPRVKAVTLTGSEKAGMSVASIAGSQIKKSVLELGGSDALIVLADADLEKAAQTAVQSRMQNAGQSCIAAKRFIVEKSVRKEFTEQVLSHIQAIQQGDPTLETTTMGPVARVDLAETIESQCAETVRQGARMLSGGNREGCNVQPILLDRVKPGMTAFDQETFGPLAVIVEAKDEQDAVKLANQSQYGLGSALWTRDLERAERLARQIQAGSVFVNSLMRSDPRVPFGGVKLSGFGRELAEVGMKEFLNIKTVWME